MHNMLMTGASYDDVEPGTGNRAKAVRRIIYIFENCARAL